MSGEIRISETNPFEDTIFLIRAEVAQRTPAHIRLRNIELIMDEFHKVMESVQSKTVVPLQQFPTGTDE